MSEKNEDVFHLGLTMAGAVSAGCYTAGVMDYLFEILDLWEKAKNGKIDGIDPKLVPTHKVVIEAMGGASAGGMATIMTALYALHGDVNPVKDIPENPMKSYNVLYDSWVHLDDDKNEKSFKKIWDTDDLDSKGLVSLFNSKIIDSIASKALNMVDEEKKKNFPNYVEDKVPNYISDDLEIILSHTMLRGIPLSVDFKTEIARKYKNSPKHYTFEHYLVSHFKLNNGMAVDADKYLWFNPFDSEYSDKIKWSTIATGAFPIGLAYREFDAKQFTDNYIKSITKRVIYGDFGKENPDTNNEIKLDNSVENFTSMAIDGGAINNEPYREVESILRKFHDDTKELQNYGLFMIDPFPDNDDILKPYKRPKNLIGVVPNIIKTLWNQSKVKRKEMLEQYNPTFFKGVIYPRKHITEGNTYIKPDKYPIASASFQAFGGFLDVNFRVHDFFLGRNNARNFVRYFGSLPYDPDNSIIHPIHKNWTPEMVKRFKVYKYEEEGDNRIFLPIIPDLNMLLENKKPADDRYNYTYKEKPKYDAKELISLKSNISNRFKRILDKVEEEVLSKDEKADDETPITDSWMNYSFRRNWFQRRLDSITSWIAKGFKKPGKKFLASSLTKFTIKTILEDLEKMKILKTKD